MFYDNSKELDQIDQLQAQIETLQAQVKELEGNRVPHSMQHVIELQAMNDRLEQQVEALQQERDDALHAANGMSNDLTSIGTERDALQDALDAEREKVKGLQAQNAEWERKCRDLCLAHGPLLIEHHDVKRDLTQLQALVRALPEMFGTITVEQISQTGTNCALFDAGGWIATVDGESVAKALKSLLQYRATLAATTPAKEQTKATVFHEWDGALRKMADVKPKGGDGE